MTDAAAQHGLRAADADRDATVDRLGTAMSEGRLGPNHYQDRLERAYEATTYAELDRLVADLPGPPPTTPPTERATVRRRRRCCW